MSERNIRTGNIVTWTVCAALLFPEVTQQQAKQDYWHLQNLQTNKPWEIFVRYTYIQDDVGHSGVENDHGSLGAMNCT